MQEQNTTAQAGQPEAVNGRECYTVMLEKPIKREGGDVHEVKIMKPNPGDMRGLSMKSVWDMDTHSIMVLLPRITNPSLVAHEVNAMDIADLLECGGAVVNFLLPKAVRQQITA